MEFKDKAYIYPMDFQKGDIIWNDKGDKKYIHGVVEIKNDYLVSEGDTGDGEKKPVNAMELMGYTLFSRTANEV